jgi:hypothetical protein
VPHLEPADHRDQAGKVSTNAATCWAKPHILILGAQQQKMQQMGLVTGREHRSGRRLSVSIRPGVPPTSVGILSV